MNAWSVLELWRRRGRLAGVIVTMATLCTLAAFLVALGTGLWAGATGAIADSGAGLMVFSPDSLTSFARSRLPLSEVPVIARLPGVAAAGAMGALPVG